MATLFEELQRVQTYEYTEGDVREFEACLIQFEARAKYGDCRCVLSSDRLQQLIGNSGPINVVSIISRPAAPPNALPCVRCNACRSTTLTPSS